MVRLIPCPINSLIPSPLTGEGKGGGEIPSPLRGEGEGGGDGMPATHQNTFYNVLIPTLLILTLLLPVCRAYLSACYAQAGGTGRPLAQAEETAQNQTPRIQPPISSLSLQEAIDYALVNSPLMKTAQLNVALAKLDIKATRLWSRILPTPNLHYGYNPILGENRLGVTLNFNIDELLGKGSIQSRRARLRLFDAENYLSTAKRKVVVTVTRSYFDYIIARERIRLAEGQLAREVKLREVVKTKFEAGQVELDQLLKMDTTINQVRLDLLRAKADAQIAELKLKEDIGY